MYLAIGTEKQNREEERREKVLSLSEAVDNLCFILVASLLVCGWPSVA